GERKGLGVVTSVRDERDAAPALPRAANELLRRAAPDVESRRSCESARDARGLAVLREHELDSEPPTRLDELGGIDRRAWLKADHSDRMAVGAEPERRPVVCATAFSSVMQEHV